MRAGSRASVASLTAAEDPLTVSVPSAELTTLSAAPRSRASVRALSDRLTGGRLYLALAVVALIIGALSLLIPSTPSYDPWAWLVWGREIAHLNLQTTGGPTWKPLPVIFTTIFSIFGKAAPNLWLVVGRAGAVMAVAMVFKLCARFARQLGGRPAPGAGALEVAISWMPAVLAGCVASIGLIFAGGYITANALGYSEGLMTAIVLISVERHLDGKPRQAFAVGFFAALDRPEIWLFWGAYGLWLWWKDPGARKLVIFLFALIPVFWFLPEYWGSGHFFRGVNRAHNPRSNSPAFAKCPFCTELGDHAWPTVPSRIKAVAIVAIALALFELGRATRSRGRFRLEGGREHTLAAIAMAGILGFAWWILIALMTQAGFSGNDRYLVLGAALIEIAGGVGWAWAAIEFSRVVPRLVRGLSGAGGWLRAGAVALVAVVFVFVPSWVFGLVHLSKTHRALNYQALLRKDASAAIDRLGGAKAVLGCGSVMTEGFQVPMIAYDLGVHTLQIEASPLSAPPPNTPGPNVIFQTRAQRNAHLLPSLHNWPSTHYKRVTATRTFRVYENCRVTS
jgi:hypothetical protein